MTQTARAQSEKQTPIPAVSVEKGLLFAGQSARPPAVKVHHAITVALDGVRRRDHVGASVAGRLECHLDLRGMESTEGSTCSRRALGSARAMPTNVDGVAATSATPGTRPVGLACNGPATTSAPNRRAAPYHRSAGRRPWGYELGESGASFRRAPVSPIS